MHWRKAILAFPRKLYCSRACQRILPGGGRDRQGKKLMSAGKWADAEAHYNQLLAEYPGRALFRERAANVKQAHGDLAAAESILSALALQFPEVPRFAIHLSSILLMKKSNQKAVDILEKALAHTPDSTNLLLCLVKGCRAQENWSKEKAYFLRYLEKRRGQTSVLIEYFTRCRQNNDIEAIKAIKHDTEFKEYFLHHHYNVDEVRNEIFGGFTHFSAEYFSKTIILSGLQLARCAVRPVDCRNEFVTIANGLRRTVCVPENYDETIWLLGSSTLYGTACEDAHTIASFLQQLFNAQPGKNMRIVNLGAVCQGNPNAFLSIMAERPRKGDIVLFFPPPATWHAQHQADMHDIDFRYYRAMRDFCARAGVFFTLLFSRLLLPSPTLPDVNNLCK